MRSRWKTRGGASTRSVAISVALTAGLVCLATAAAGGFARPHHRFGNAGAASLPSSSLFDIGVTDYDGDGFLDLFTSNHKSRSALLRNDGSGNFTDQLPATGLSPTPAFPGLELLERPKITEPGLYLYFRDPRLPKKGPSYLHIRAVGIAAAGRLTFTSEKVDVARSRGADVTRGRSEAGQRTVEFTAQPGARIDISPNHLDVPIAASFSRPQPNYIRVGSYGVRPRSNSFVLSLRDRHGLAFANLGGDGATDLFTVLGGLGGDLKLPAYRGEIQDELHVRHGATFSDETLGSGLRKGSCRGRQAAAVDINADGLLDLFEGCDEKPPSIYLRRAGGGFERAPAPPSSATTFRWVDLLGSRGPELLAAEVRGIRVYEIGEHRSRVVQRIPGQPGVTQFALADYDADGDLDVLAVSDRGNALLRNQDGRLHAIPPRVTGLPRESVAASFVDYDNDGRLDLHLIPQGLYRRGRDGRFRRTGMQATRQVGNAITTWFDYDNDGLRDPVVAIGQKAFSTRKRISRAHNLGPGGHWLEVELTGPANNSQAIGSRVRIRYGTHRQYGFVGQSDDSRYSQGHYRLYFGLGGFKTVRNLEVRWSDGTRSRFGPLPADQLLRLSYQRP